MNYRELRERVEALCRLEGWSDTPDAPDWGALVNRALARFSLAGEYIFGEATITTTAGTAEYSLLETSSSPDWVSVSYVMLSDGSELRRTNPIEVVQSIGWNVASAGGQPSYWWICAPNRIRLCPTPDRAYTLRVFGHVCEPRLTSDTDEPIAFESYHEDICKLAAVIHGETYATGEAQLLKLRMWEEAAQRAAEACRTRIFEGRTATWQRQVYGAPVRKVQL